MSGVGEKPPQPVQSPGITRRFFIKLLAVLSGLLALGPFQSIIDFVVPSTKATKIRTRITNVADMPMNSAKFFYYPSTADPFYLNILIRLKDGTFRAFNRTCVHLMCQTNYFPPRLNDPKDFGRIACPCHGSQYDPASGTPVAGPAYTLGLNPLPEVKLEIDSKGEIYAVDFIGEVGFGRTRTEPYYTTVG